MLLYTPHLPRRMRKRKRLTKRVDKAAPPPEEVQPCAVRRMTSRPCHRRKPIRRFLRPLRFPRIQQRRLHLRPLLKPVRHLRRSLPWKRPSRRRQRPRRRREKFIRGGVELPLFERVSWLSRRPGQTAIFARCSDDCGAYLHKPNLASSG